MRTCFSRIIHRWIPLLCCLVLATACGGGDRPAPPEGSTPTASETTAGQAQPSTGVRPTETDSQVAGGAIDPCSLLTKAEVEAAVGRSVLGPQKEQAGHLAICSYGDPAVPLVNGRPLSQIVTISVLVGSDAEYHAGAAAQAKSAFEIGRKNAASVQPVSGLGDDAYWDRVWRSLSVLRGEYEFEVKITADAGGLDVARNLAAKIQERLP